MQDFRELAVQELLNDAAADYGNHMLNLILREVLVHERLRNSTVPIPVVDCGNTTGVILAKHADKLKNHSG